MNFSQGLLAAQIACLAFAVILILIQNRGAGLSSSFGGKDEIYLTRRGIEKSVVRLTVIFIVTFVVLRFISFYVGY
jgi:protein translocase SecG subunit